MYMLYTDMYCRVNYMYSGGKKVFLTKKVKVLFVALLHANDF